MPLPLRPIPRRQWPGTRGSGSTRSVWFPWGSCWHLLLHTWAADCSPVATPLTTDNIYNANDRDATAPAVGAARQDLASAVGGGSDGARTRDLRRDRPAL